MNAVGHGPCSRPSLRGLNRNAFDVFHHSRYRRMTNQAIAAAHSLHTLSLNSSRNFFFLCRMSNWMKQQRARITWMLSLFAIHFFFFRFFSVFFSLFRFRHLTCDIFMNALVMTRQEQSNDDGALEFYRIFVRFDEWTASNCDETETKNHTAVTVYIISFRLVVLLLRSEPTAHQFKLNCFVGDADLVDLHFGSHWWCDTNAVKKP